MENIESPQFTETENKIRKKWLFWSTILPTIVFGCLIIFALYNSLISSDFMGLLGILSSSLLIVGGFYMNYYCAYKNPGTVLLLLMTIGILLNLSTTSFSGFAIGMFFFQFTVLYYSYKLRQINKEMKEKRLVTSPTYINAISVFSTATNLEELNAQFSNLRSNSESAVKILTKAYERQKKKLSL